jgi:hypothetical protein
VRPRPMEPTGGAGPAFGLITQAAPEARRPGREHPDRPLAMTSDASATGWRVDLPFVAREGLREGRTGERGTQATHHRFGRGLPRSQRSAQRKSTCTPTFRSMTTKLAAATGTDGEQKLQNNRPVPDAAWDTLLKSLVGAQGLEPWTR